MTLKLAFLIHKKSSALLPHPLPSLILVKVGDLGASPVRNRCRSRVVRETCFWVTRMRSELLHRARTPELSQACALLHPWSVSGSSKRNFSSYCQIPIRYANCEESLDNSRRIIFTIVIVKILLFSMIFRLILSINCMRIFLYSQESALAVYFKIFYS